MKMAGSMGIGRAWINYSGRGAKGLSGESFQYD